jgi:glutaredoxin 3
MEFLSQHGIEFTARNIAVDQAAREEMTRRMGRMSVPVIVVDGDVVMGFDRGRLTALLGLG